MKITKEHWDLLLKDFDESAVQRTKAIDTKKGYDTTGYGYQYIVDRFNDVLGDDWGFEWSSNREIQGEYKNGTPYFEITVRMGIWIGEKGNMRYCVGGHTSVTYHDALKGAITNAFKKTAAFWGVGAKAFRGEIDPDNAPLPADHDQKNGHASERLDFKVVQDRTSSMNESELVKYQEELLTKFKLTEKQKYWIQNHFEQCFSRLANPIRGL